jgi:hypothetical protein
MGSRDSMVSVVIGYRLEGLRFKYRQVQEIFLFSNTSRSSQPPIQSVPGHENGQSTPSSAKLRISGVIPLLTVCAFMACEGITLVFLLTKMISRQIACFSNDIFEDSGRL